ncbi:MAG: hypothetical protein OES38_06970 [Gammaproteobacteria bacterium]|nr:hypothetical protein [Gammaproteobacteria bacterium]
MSEQLIAGDTFPQLNLNTVGGDTRSLPDDIDTDYAVVLFYRGHW